jgi:putative transposase
MPIRKVVLANNQIYHILNRSLHRIPIFQNVKEKKRIIDLINYYSLKKRPCKFSRYKQFSKERKERVILELNPKGEKRVEIICFCLMPNHFHLLLRQRQENGVTRFMGDLQNSYVRYYNIKNNRKGPLFESQYKAVRISSEEQLLHVSRYIHLNPYSGYVVKNVNGLINYEWSSFKEYLNLANQELCNKNIILNRFNNSKEYKQFVLARANYQKSLEVIKHLLME